MRLEYSLEPDITVEELVGKLIELGNRVKNPLTTNWYFDGNLRCIVVEEVADRAVNYGR